VPRAPMQVKTLLCRWWRGGGVRVCVRDGEADSGEVERIGECGRSQTRQKSSDEAAHGRQMTTAQAAATSTYDTLSYDIQRTATMCVHALRSSIYRTEPTTKQWKQKN